MIAPSIAAMEQPKKPTGGAFGQYLKANRPALTKECAGQPVTAISKLAGANFKAMSDAEKVPYQQKYEEAQKKYTADMAAFLAAGGEKTKKEGKKRKGEVSDDEDGKSGKRRKKNEKG